VPTPRLGDVYEPVTAVAEPLLEIAPEVLRVDVGVGVRRSVEQYANLAVFVSTFAQGLERVVEGRQRGARRRVLDRREQAEGVAVHPWPEVRGIAEAGRAGEGVEHRVFDRGLVG